MNRLVTVLVVVAIAAAGYKLGCSRPRGNEPPPGTLPHFQTWTPASGEPRSQVILERFVACLAGNTTAAREIDCSCRGDFARSHVEPPADITGACAPYVAEHVANAGEDRMQQLYAPVPADVVIPTAAIVRYMQRCLERGPADPVRARACGCHADYVIDHAPARRPYTTNAQLVDLIDQLLADSDPACH
jgi:hypothetical protein